MEAVWCCSGLMETNLGRLEGPLSSGTRINHIPILLKDNHFDGSTWLAQTETAQAIERTY